MASSDGGSGGAFFCTEPRRSRPFFFVDGFAGEEGALASSAPVGRDGGALGEAAVGETGALGVEALGGLTDPLPLPGLTVEEAR